MKSRRATVTRKRAMVCYIGGLGCKRILTRRSSNLVQYLSPLARKQSKNPLFSQYPVSLSKGARIKPSQPSQEIHQNVAQAFLSSQPVKMLSLNDFFPPASLLSLFFLRNRFIGSLLSTPLINTIHNLLLNNNKGEGRGLKREKGGLINFSSPEEGGRGGLIRGRGLI